MIQPRVGSRWIGWVTTPALVATAFLPLNAWSRQTDFTLNIDTDLPCAIVNDIRRQGGADPYAWFEARRAEARAQAERNASLQPRSDNDESARTYDLRWPLLSKVMFWFFSTDEYLLPFSIHRIDSNPPFSGRNLFLALNDLQQRLGSERPVRSLVENPARLEAVIHQAQSDDRYRFSEFPPGVFSSDVEFQATLWLHLARRASSLVERLLPQPRRSVSHLQLYSIALDISKGDVLGALGLISTTLFMEADKAPRRLLAVLNERVEPIYRYPGTDHVGPNYHFWNYLTRALVYPRDTPRQRLLSFAYERVNQGDLDDYHADQAGIRMAQGIERALRFGSNVCRRTGTR